VFDTRATSRSYELWASEHLSLVVAAGVGLTTAALAGVAFVGKGR
jgi:hypothetical protein